MGFENRFAEDASVMTPDTCPQCGGSLVPLGEQEIPTDARPLVLFRCPSCAAAGTGVQPQPGHFAVNGDGQLLDAWTLRPVRERG